MLFEVGGEDGGKQQIDAAGAAADGGQQQDRQCRPRAGEQVQHAGEQFVLKGQDIFKVMLGITTDTPSMYKDFLKNK